MTVKDFIKKLNPNDVLDGYIAFKLYTQFYTFVSILRPLFTYNLICEYLEQPRIFLNEK